MNTGQKRLQVMKNKKVLRIKISSRSLLNLQGKFMQIRQRKNQNKD